jgi:hypothetical protein
MYCWDRGVLELYQTSRKVNKTNIHQYNKNLKRSHLESEKIKKEHKKVLMIYQGREDPT